VLALMGAATFAAEDCEAGSGPDDAAIRAFIDRARAATDKYHDRSAAIADGYRLIGRDFPAMGEHWIHIGLLFDGKYDPAAPEFLSYVTVGGAPWLLGVAYALPLLPGESPPEVPVGRDVWHAHFRTVEDETLIPVHGGHGAGHEDVPRLAMMHAWIWLDNPAGMFAPDNWAVPYVRLGLTPPAGSPDSAARALSLLTGGGDQFFAAVVDGMLPDPDARAAAETALRQAHEGVEDLLRQHSGPALTTSEVSALSGLWRRFWEVVEASASPETRAHLHEIPVR